MEGPLLSRELRVVEVMLPAPSPLANNQRSTRSEASGHLIEGFASLGFVQVHERAHRPSGGEGVSGKWQRGEGGWHGKQVLFGCQLCVADRQVNANGNKASRSERACVAAGPGTEVDDPLDPEFLPSLNTRGAHVDSSPRKRSA